MRRIRCCVAVFAVMFGLSAGATAQAQAMREVRSLPSDCRSVSDQDMSGVQRWQALVALEQCDRIKRLRRLSEVLPPAKRPIFYVGVVPAERLPAEFGIDVPVLRVVFPDNVFFDTARSELRAEAAVITAIMAESLRREPPDVALFVAGHADRRGDAQYNRDLSIDRANALAEAVFAQGVAFSSIWRVGFGEDMPLVGGDDDYAHDRNRRIEFLFAARPEAVGTWLADQQVTELCQARTRTDAERCKASLDLRRDYEAVEIIRRAPTRVVPRASGPTRADPTRSSRRPIGIGRKGAVSTSPPRVQTVQIAPAGSRVFRIDPIARRAALTKITL